MKRTLGEYLDELEKVTVFEKEVHRRYALYFLFNEIRKDIADSVFDKEKNEASWLWDKYLDLENRLNDALVENEKIKRLLEGTRGIDD